jgi:hypothetical protein
MSHEWISGRYAPACSRFEGDDAARNGVRCRDATGPGYKHNAILAIFVRRKTYASGEKGAVVGDGQACSVRDLPQGDGISGYVALGLLRSLKAISLCEGMRTEESQPAMANKVRWKGHGHSPSGMAFARAD